MAIVSGNWFAFGICQRDGWEFVFLRCLARNYIYVGRSRKPKQDNPQSFALRHFHRYGGVLPCKCGIHGRIAAKRAQFGRCNGCCGSQRIVGQLGFGNFPCRSGSCGSCSVVGFNGICPKR